MLKIFGMVFVFVGSVGIGGSINHRMREHYRQLLQQKELILMIGNEMRYLKLPIPQVMRRTAANCREPYAAALSEMAEQMVHNEVADIGMIWRKVLTEHRMKFLLSEEEFSILLQAGAVFSQSSGYMQGEEVALYVGQLDYRIEVTQRELAGKQRLCRYLSAAGGAFVILMLL